MEQNSVLAAEIADSTGDLTALFYGRSRIPGLMCGSRVRFRGAVGIKNGVPVMINPAYELMVPFTSGKPVMWVFTGDSITPSTGYSTPAATGTSATLYA